MRSFVGVSSKRYAVLLAGVSLGVVALLPNLAAAQTAVEASLCNGGNGSTVTILSPASGTTFTTVPVAISGAVSSASQIDVTVDGEYDSTIPIAAGQTDFLFDLTLSEGSHTVDFVANDRCHYQNGSATLTLTYTPTTNYTGTTPTATTVTGSTTGSAVGSGVQITPQTTGTPSSGASGADKSPIAVLIEPVQAIATALDVDSTLKDGAAQGALRVSLIVSGAFMASVGSTSCVSVLEFFRQAAHASRIRKYFSVHRFVRESAFRFGGLMLFMLAFLI